jgi:hypothetical protein
MDVLVHARFWSKVEVTQNTCRCWEWKGRRDAWGYGEFKLQGAATRAHRVAVQMTGVPLQPGEVVMHTCDNPACCNPTHLVVGDHAMNVADRVAKRRSAKGAKNGRSKLTEKQVLAIRADDRTLTEVARDYGVCIATISHIRQRKIWQHI